MLCILFYVCYIIHIFNITSITVKGHYLVLTSENDTILGKMELKEAERKVDESHEPSKPEFRNYKLL